MTRNLRMKCVFRYDEIQGHFRLFRVMWESGEGPGFGRGHSNMLSVAIQPALFRCKRDYAEWLLVVCGIRLHRKRSYGGVFA